MTERIVDPDDYLSDIVATRRWAYLDDQHELRFTDSIDEAGRFWHCEVVVGDYVPKSLPLKLPLDLQRAKDAGRFTEAPVEPRSMYPRWIERLQRSRNGVEIVVASLVAGTAGALIGFGIGTIY